MVEKNKLQQYLHEYPDGNIDESAILELEELKNNFPFFAPAQYLFFITKKNNFTNDDIAKLALYKGNPLLFADFIKCQKNKTISTHAVDSDDILTLINQLPNKATLDDSKEIISSLSHHYDGQSDIQTQPDKSLMVMMSFTEWLQHLKTRTAKEKQEYSDQKALKTAWQKEKLALLSEEENEEIPENIFKQAMESISDNTIISESLAKILTKQGKLDRALDMYKKLSLQYPEKSSYFAPQIKELNTLKDH